MKMMMKPMKLNHQTKATVKAFIGEHSATSSTLTLMQTTKILDSEDQRRKLRSMSMPMSIKTITTHHPMRTFVRQYTASSSLSTLMMSKNLKKEWRTLNMSKPMKAPLPSSLLARRHHGDDEHLLKNPVVKLIFVRRDGTEVKVDAHVGENLLRVGQRYELEIEGACEGSVACSTCHVILDQDVYDELPPAKDNEEDMLDMAFGLTSTSRLGCQVLVTENMEGARVRLPKATRNFYVDGHQPKPH